MPRSPFPVSFIPPGVLPDARLLLWARGLRAFGDGYVSLLLPYYLTLLGFSALEIGAIVTATLLGSGLMTLGVGFIAHRFRQRALLEIAALMMAATGIAFVLTDRFLAAAADRGRSARSIRPRRCQRVCAARTFAAHAHGRAPSTAPHCLRATA